MAHLILVVPCYNEERRLPVQGFEAFSLPGHRVEFCFVDDGSTDGTAHVLRRLQERQPGRCWSVSLPRNSGKAEAVRRGFLAALERKPDHVGFWDADLATPLDEVGRLVEALEADPDRQMVFGARVQLMGRTIERRASRHYLGRVFATAVSLSLGLPIYDTQCGAKLFRATGDLAAVFASPFRSRWIFDVEIVARFLQVAARDGRPPAERAIYELPLRRWKDVAGTKLKPADFLRAVRELWTIRRAYPRLSTSATSAARSGPPAGGAC